MEIIKAESFARGPIMRAMTQYRVDRIARLPSNVFVVVDATIAGHSRNL